MPVFDEPVDYGLAAEELAFARIVLGDLAKERGVYCPLPPSVPRACRYVDKAVALLLSLERQANGADTTELYSVGIGTQEVAEILQVTPRTAQRKAKALGATKVSGTWIFDRSEIGT